MIDIGIHSVLVALLAQRAEVKYDPSEILPTQISTLINHLGFHAEVLEKVARGMEMIDINVNIYFILKQKNSFKKD